MPGRQLACPQCFPTRILPHLLTAPTPAQMSPPPLTLPLVFLPRGCLRAAPTSCLSSDFAFSNLDQLLQAAARQAVWVRPSIQKPGNHPPHPPPLCLTLHSLLQQVLVVLTPSMPRVRPLFLLSTLLPPSSRPLLALAWAGSLLAPAQQWDRFGCVVKPT